jgi:hypothetical protein
MRTQEVNNLLYINNCTPFSGLPADEYFIRQFIIDNMCVLSEISDALKKPVSIFEYYCSIMVAGITLERADYYAFRNNYVANGNLSDGAIKSQNLKPLRMK